MADLRIYRITDHADNAITLALKVRCSPRAWEASVLGVRYDDERHDRGAEDANRPPEDGRPELRGGGQWGDHERNTIIFERLVGRDAAGTLLGVEQVVSIGEGDGRTTVRCRYDVLDDLTLLEHETGSACCEDRERTSALETDLRGLLLLHVATHNGRLVVEE